MRLFGNFVGALDSTGEHLSARLSEIDLSDPEDVRALIPDNGSELLVHFGDSDFLDRYRGFQAHLPEWKEQYPKLASVDMRYERQAVLEMTPGAAVPLNEAANAAKTIPQAPPKPGSKPRPAANHPPAAATSHGSAAAARDKAAPR